MSLTKTKDLHIRIYIFIYIFISNGTWSVSICKTYHFSIVNMKNKPAQRYEIEVAQE